MPYEDQIAQVHEHLALLTSAADPEAQAAAERLAAALDPALRLLVQNVMAEAAEDLGKQLRGCAEVELRIVYGEPVLLAVPISGSAQTEAAGQDTAEVAAGDPEEVTRFTLRVPTALKTRLDEAARSAGVSTNTWVVRATERALPNTTDRSSRTRASRHVTGWLG